MTTDSPAPQPAPARTVVLDAGPLLRLPSSALAALDARLVTTPDVLAEVRDKRAKQSLAALAVDVLTRNPSEEAFDAVTSFAKKTGDFSVLSVTDLKVLALTWMLEKEARGSAHLRLAPRPPTVVVPGADSNGTVQKESVQGSVEAPAVVEEEHKEEQGRKEGEEVIARQSDSDSDSEDDDENEDEEGEGEGEEGGGEGEGEEQRQNGETKETEAQDEDVNTTKDQPDSQPIPAPVDSRPADASSPAAPSTSHAPSTTPAPSTSTSHPAPSASTSTLTTNPAQPATADNDDEGWITPANVHLHKAKAAHKGKAQDEVWSVGCMTGDFAMQNVLLQMNLRLLSLDGMLIKKVKTTVGNGDRDVRQEKLARNFAGSPAPSWSEIGSLHATLSLSGATTVDSPSSPRLTQQPSPPRRITTDMSKKFCPSCGGNTLMRVSARVDADGGIRVFLKKNFQYNLRGSKGFGQARVRKGGLERRGRRCFADHFNRTAISHTRHSPPIRTAVSSPTPIHARRTAPTPYAQYNVPPPQFGRKAQNLIRAEDQPEYVKALKTQEWAVRKDLQTRAHFFDPDWAPDMLVQDDADRRRALKSARQRGVAGPVVGYGKKNPNEARRGGGGKKKR
ncbi:hypothetical protein M427DRAFT_34668 [Gonapodya prolifera JEL478]|uniref:20S-pre-rRNA D-site endonuclease NOB1 n=1 Tax=Gonapodya prolifera (strain JEL478) TaxID=1344416 RepID=A0A139A794_GONPJ|nr:hypothetical protein M427DRAFT_34668 [Gonapodya prolifera JEL478]|eukprot:KXS12670.1 hypothetical protein M427DRAFT_34668 [Gonapodya prolifera JEL478]